MKIAGSLTYDTKLDTTGFEKGLGKINTTSVAVGNLLADAFKGVARAMGDVVKQGVQYNGQLEQYKVSLETLTGSAEEANRVMKNIKEDAAKTPFDVKELTSANSLLISAGVDADKARKDVINLGNAISATGGGNDELSRMAVNLQQIKNVGKASALDIKQFAYAGIDIYGLLADSMGITREEATKVDVTYEQLTKSLEYASQEGGRYHGAMEEQSKTLNGQLSTLKDNFMEFAGKAAEPLFNFLKDTALPALNDLLSGGEKVKTWLRENEQPITVLAILIGAVTTAVIAYNVATNIATIATTLATAATSAFGAVMSFVTSPITLVVLAIGALIAIGYLLIKNWDKVKETALKVFTWIADFFKGIAKKIGNIFSGMFDVGKNIVMGIWNGIKGAKDWLLNKIKGFGKSITNGIKKTFGIHSPSKVMKDEVGQWLPKGIAVGIDANTDSALKSIDKMNDEIMDKMNKAVNVETARASFNGTSGSVSEILNTNSIIKVENYNTLELDGEKVYENQETIKKNKNLQYGFGGRQ